MRHVVMGYAAVLAACGDGAPREPDSAAPPGVPRVELSVAGPAMVAAYSSDAPFSPFSDGGGTLPGQIFVHLRGNFWELPVEAWDAEQRRFLPVFFAHEVAHLFQRVEGVDRDPNDSWIHKSGAAVLALNGAPGAAELAGRMSGAARPNAGELAAAVRGWVEPT